jgi:Protein of unknown function (DUF3486)
MGRKSTISRLPLDVKLYIEGQIADGRWTLDEMIADLRERFPEHKAAGELPSRAALHRYGPKLERRLIAVKAFSQAAASIEANAGDRGDSRSSALTAIVQQELFDSMMCLQDATDPEVDQDTRMKLLAEAARSLASLTRSSVQLKQYQAKVEAETRARVLEEQRAKLDAMGTKGGITPETKAAIREALGIV